MFKKIGLWDIALGVLCAIFVFKELAIHVVSIMPVIFYALNALLLVAMGFIDIKSNLKMRKKSSLIICSSGILACLLSYPYFIKLLFYRMGMQAMKIENFVYLFLGYYIIHLILYIRLDENKLKDRTYLHK